MQRHPHKKYYLQVGLLVITAILVTIITSLLRYYIFEKFNKSKSESSSVDQTKTSLEQCYQIAKQVISKREILKQDKTNSIIIGRHVKELENGYFDMKWEQQDHDMIWINLLCKENVTAEHRYEVSYGEEIIMWIQQVKQVTLSKSEVQELLQKIIKAYLSVRDPSTVQTALAKETEDTYIEHLYYPTMEITIQVKNHMVMLEIIKR